MSILRQYPLKQPTIGNFNKQEEYIFEFCEGAEDMEKIKAKLEKGEPVPTRIGVSTSQYMTEEEMNKFEPKEINDITDIDNIKEYQDKINQQEEQKEKEE